MFYRLRAPIVLTQLERGIALGMKQIMMVGLCLAGIYGATARLQAQGYFMAPGATYTYEFTNFVFQAGDAVGPYAEVGLSVSSLVPVYSFQFTAFENGSGQTALLTTNFTASATTAVFALGPVWQDRQGLFTLQMLSGSMTLLDFYGSVVDDAGNYYSEKPPVVPEPSVAVLWGGAMLAVVLPRWWRQAKTRLSV